MASYKVCKYCNSSLDPCEKCDCKDTLDRMDQVQGSKFKGADDNLVLSRTVRWETSREGARK